MDSGACNYNNLATTDNGSCVMHPENYNCEGKCISFLDCNGVCGGPLLGTGIDNLGNDECGVCEGLGAPEHYNCLGECTSGVDCNGACGGPLLGTGLDDLGNDECGVCEGLGAPEHYNCLGECTSGVDCNGACGGTSGLDECGMCGGGGIADGKCDCDGNSPTDLWGSDNYDCSGAELSLFNGLVPEGFSIHSVYPNPFNPITNIIYGLPEHVNVQIVVYDLSGKQVATLINQFQTPGYHVVDWNADHYPSGVYFIRIDSEEFTKTQKVMLVK
jgi:hypothetical protein